MSSLIKKQIVEEKRRIDLKSTNIPIAAYIIGTIFLLPAIFLLIIMFVAEHDTPTSIWVVLVKVMFFVLAMVMTAFKRMRNLVIDAVVQPTTITVGFLVSAYFIVQNNFAAFTREEGPGFKNALPYAIVLWLLFPIIQSSWFIKRVPKWLLWIIRIPIWGVVFITTMILLETFAISLFGQLG